MKVTKHSIQRSSQRGLRQDAIAFALANGHREFRQGRVFYIVLDSQLHARREKVFRGVVVVTSQDGWVITAWRDPAGLKKIRRKPRASWRAD